MAGRRAMRVVLTGWALLILTAGAAQAQSAIAGVAKDASGGVIPGVTVEASSPVLIEKVRTAVTDEHGQYKIVDLRPGTYSVVFTLPGFNTFKRDGIELPADFTATVNAELGIGALEETVTVSGESPVVDVHNAVAQQVLPQKLLDAVPMGGRNIQSVGATLVSVQQSAPDVGGSAGMQQTYMTAHGSDPRDNTIMVDGIRLNGIEGDGAIQQYFNEGMFSEMSYQTGGLGAETSGGGVRINMIPKDGGNTIKTDVFFSTTGSSLQANPLPADLAARGLKSGASMHSMHDVNVSAGGPLVVDKLWFFGSFRHWGVDQTVPNSFAATPNTPQVTGFVPDASQPVVDGNLIKSFMTRFTWQASSKNRFSFYFDKLIKFRGAEQTTPPGTSPTVWSLDTYSTRQPKQYYMTEAKWTTTFTSRLLLQAGVGVNNESYTSGELQPDLEACLAAGTCAPRPSVDIATGQSWGAPQGPFYVHKPVRETGTGSLSYVTGSHAFKTGMEFSHGFSVLQQNYQNPAINFIQQFNGGAPFRVTIYSAPLDEEDRLKADLGIYVQDAWTLNRLTLTPGIRFEYFKVGYDEEGVSVASQSLLLTEGYAQRPLFPALDMPTWKNWAPRFGAVYDVFGNGKTAIKGGINKYMIAYSTTTFPQVYNPMVLSSDTRTWTDTNKNLKYDPGIDQLSASTNALFGQLFRSPDPNIRRPYDVELSLGISHELRPGVSVSFGYFHRSWYDLIASDNPVLDQPGAFTPVTMANPCAGGTINCGGAAPSTITVYAINPALIGKGTIVDTNSSNTRVYNAFEETFMARVGKGQFFGGANSQRQVSNFCQSSTLNGGFSAAVGGFTAASDPNFAGPFCDQTQYSIPFVTQFKLGGAYPLKYGVNVAGTFQSYPGTTGFGSGITNANWLNVNLLATSANSPLAKGQSETIPLIYPGGKYLPRLNQLDVRVARKFPLPRGGEWQVQLDLFNALNSHPVTSQSTTYGTTLDVPTGILQSRMVSFGAQLHF
ncbi:MAG: carboxypeptidase regulatory-like domain-containing protein [Acidobacteriia bacterium]|nr:carboxypeptidase regulatory-like domain-containing protein [Terriglobia bacterium]